MPELPEVETIRRQLETHLVGRTVRDAGAHVSPKFASAVDVIGTTLISVNRRGKYLLIDTADARELVIHLGMTGRLSLTAEPPTPGATSVPGSHLRAWWCLDDGQGLVLDDQRRFGRVAVVPRGDYRELPTLASLGPEPLDDSFTISSFAVALSATRRCIKTALLSQRPVAGIGNIYADEALWSARINPTVRRISRRRVADLHEAIRHVLDDAINHGGTRLRDYRTLGGDTGRHQFHLSCYGRAGQPCLRCHRPLQRRLVDGRGTTWCPHCQAR